MTHTGIKIYFERIKYSYHFMLLCLSLLSLEACLSTLGQVHPRRWYARFNIFVLVLKFIQSLSVYLAFLISPIILLAFFSPGDCVFGHVYCFHPWNFSICWLQDVLHQPFHILGEMEMGGGLELTQSGELQQLLFRLKGQHALCHCVWIILSFTVSCFRCSFWALNAYCSLPHCFNLGFLFSCVSSHV